jgi:hypothetical protein
MLHKVVYVIKWKDQDVVIDHTKRYEDATEARRGSFYASNSRKTDGAGASLSAQLWEL